MIVASEISQAEFYQEFLMARGKFDPHDFGVNLSREEFTDQMAEFFNEIYRATITVDELLLRPSEASHFVSDVRRRFGYYDVPEDIILRVIMTRRKNPGG